MDRPIIFSAPMVRSLLENRKTMTRRLALTSRKLMEESKPDSYRSKTKIMDSPWKKCQPGDRLWVRESFCGPIYELDDNDQPTGEREYFFRVDGYPYGSYLDQETDERRDAPPWTPSIHMPRRLSRLTLIVTGVKVERLQDISKEDAIAEGCTSRPNCSGFRQMYEGWSMDWSEVGRHSNFATGGPGPLLERDISLATAQSGFLAFINKLHGGERWNCNGKVPLADQNPSVVAITFRVIKANIDSAEARIAA